MKNSFLSLYKKVHSFINKHKKIIHPTIMIFSCLVVLGSIYLLMRRVPILADDYTYSFVFLGDANERITGIHDIFISQYKHYMYWGGRTVVHVIAQLLLMLDLRAIAIINAIVYLILTLLVYFHANGRKKLNISLFILINLLIWFFVPVFGQVILWKTGAANYLWGAVIVLAFLLPYRMYQGKEILSKVLKVTIPFFMLIFGILAGWTNENTAGAAILIALLFMIISKLKKNKVRLWMYTGLSGTIIGYLVMILAPGNFNRNKSFENAKPFIQKLWERFQMISGQMGMFMTGLFIIFIVLLGIFIAQKSKKTNSIFVLSMVYIVGSFASIYCMLLSPFFPDRAWFGPVLYFIIGIGMIYSEINFDNQKKFVYLGLIVSFLGFKSQFDMVYNDLSRTFAISNAREVYIESEKLKGNKNILVIGIESETPYSPFNKFGDIGIDPNQEPNITVARYFEIDSIARVKKE